MKTIHKFVMSGVIALFGSYNIGHVLEYTPQNLIGLILLLVGMSAMGYYFKDTEELKEVKQ